jgi:hypothetical protein
MRSEIEPQGNVTRLSGSEPQGARVDSRVPVRHGTGQLDAGRSRQPPLFRARTRSVHPGVPYSTAGASTMAQGVCVCVGPPRLDAGLPRQGVRGVRGIWALSG